jgi:TPR repeat protein
MAATKTPSSTRSSISSSAADVDVSSLPVEYRFPQLTPAEATVWANNYLEWSRYYREHMIDPDMSTRAPHEPRLALTLWTRLSRRDDATLAAANEGMRYAIGDAQNLIAWCLRHVGQHMAALAQYQRVAANAHYPDDVRGNSLRAAARMILIGDGDLPIDEPQAITWLERAGKMVPDGFKEAADVLLWGKNLYDPLRAISAYEIATIAGAANSRFELAKLYGLGVGVAPDKAKAFGVLALREPGRHTHSISSLHVNGFTLY